MTKEKAITIIESHKAHWQRLLREKICDEIEGRETIEGFDMAISALSAEPCREADDYENEIADLHNRLDIAEYDKERYKEEITTLEAENKGEWIPCREREPHGLSFVALDEFNNYPWVCNSLFTWKDKDGVKHFYDATGYQDTIFQGDVKAFLRGKKIQTVGGRTFYVRPPEIVAWMPLPRWMDYKPEPYKPEKPETCKGCLEPCIMYEPDMRACKKKVKEVSEK